MGFINRVLGRFHFGGMPSETSFPVSFLCHSYRLTKPIRHRLPCPLLRPASRYHPEPSILSYNIKTTRALTTPISKTPSKFLAMAAPDLVVPAEPPVPILKLVAAGLPAPCLPAGLVAVAVPV